MRPVRHLILVLGDQLDPASSAFDGFDAGQDAVWMAEVPGEAKAVWTSKPRLALFLSAMRHFRDAARAQGRRVLYVQIDEAPAQATLQSVLSNSLAALKPEKVIWIEAGEYRVERDLLRAVESARIPHEIRGDRHFLASREDFARHASVRRQLRLEFFYREMRRKHRVLLAPDVEPEGGQWNYDEANRGTFGKDGPGALPAPRKFPPDSLTQEVIGEINRRFPDHPGRLEAFD